MLRGPTESTIIRITFPLGQTQHNENGSLFIVGSTRPTYSHASLFVDAANVDGERGPQHKYQNIESKFMYTGRIRWDYILMIYGISCSSPEWLVPARAGIPIGAALMVDDDDATATVVRLEFGSMLDDGSCCGFSGCMLV